MFQQSEEKNGCACTFCSLFLCYVCLTTHIVMRLCMLTTFISCKVSTIRQFNFYKTELISKNTLPLDLFIGSPYLWNFVSYIFRILLESSNHFIPLIECCTLFHQPFCHWNLCDIENLKLLKTSSLGFSKFDKNSNLWSISK